MSNIHIPRRPNVPTPEEAYEEMLGGSVKREVIEIDLSRLVAYDGQPFRPYSQEKLQELADSIKAHGLLTPIIVRKLAANLFQILAGHNRVAAMRLLGEQKIRAIVKTVDDDEAALIMLETNLQQRIDFLPSELARAYQMQLEAMKRQGERRDLTSAPLEPKSRSNEELAEKVGKSRAQVQRYIRLNFLIPSLLTQVDQHEIAFRAGVALSYLNTAEQERLLDYLNLKHPAISLVQAEQLKKLHEEKELFLLDIEEFFEPAKAKKVPPALKEKNITIKLPYKKYSEYFPDFSAKEIAEKIQELIEEWKKTHS